MILDDATRQRLATAYATIEGTAPLLYPWDGLEASVGEGRLPVIGYGSLVNLDSAARTLAEDTRASARPAVAFGARRVFDYAMPDNLQRYGPPEDPRAKAALNVRHTATIDDCFNGIVFDMSLADIAPMREREKGYDWIPLACLPWGTLGAKPTTAWALCAPDEERSGRVHVDRSLTPHLQYYKLCREGAAAVDAGFLQLWLETTFLADGSTPMTVWEGETQGAAG